MRKRTNQCVNSSVDTEAQLRQVVKMIIVNGVVFFLCCCVQIQAFGYYLIMHVFPNTYQSRTAATLQMLANSFVVINSVVNPIIYYGFNKRYRDAFKTVFIKSKG